MIIVRIKLMGLKLKKLFYELKDKYFNGYKYLESDYINKIKIRDIDKKIFELEKHVRLYKFDRLFEKGRIESVNIIRNEKRTGIKIKYIDGLELIKDL